MRATTPKHRLGGGADTSLPPIAFPVGTLFPVEFLQEENGYYIRIIMKQAESRLRKTLEGMRRKGYSKRMGRKLHPHNAGQLAEIRDIITTPDSVEVAGHYPNSMHVTGHISNTCYIRGVPGAASGVGWELFLAFRKVVDGNELVYIHPEPVYDESRWTHHLRIKAKA